MEKWLKGQRASNGNIEMTEASEMPAMEWRNA
jgi:hypothetical protein